MKFQIATIAAQSRRLLACGVDPKTADMYWCSFLETEPFLCLGEIPVDNETGEIINEGDVSAWSLSALLELLPQSIMSQYGNEYFFELSRLRMDDQWEAQWVIHGQRFKTVNKADKSFCKLWDKSPIEACVKAIEWLVNNGYSLNKTEQ